MVRNVPMERLSQADLDRAREMSQRMPLRDVARAMRLDETTVCRAIAGFEVHRATASVVRFFLASGGAGGRI